MKINSPRVIIIGGGPSGLSCAIRILEGGGNAIILDENNEAGGQLFKQIHKFFGSSRHQAGFRGYEIGERLLNRVKRLGGEILLNTYVYGIYPGNRIGYIKEGREEVICGDKILISTGAREKSLTFPGNTLPGVMGAGASQTMANINRVLPGKRILMVGSGNVGLIVSYQLIQAGAEIAAVVEAKPEVTGYQVHLNKLKRAGVPIYTSHEVVRASGDKRINKAYIAPTGYYKDANKFNIEENNYRNFSSLYKNKINTWENLIKSFEIDTLCLAVGLSSQVELCAVAGCEFEYSREYGTSLPRYDEDLQTSEEDIYIAGDVSGVGEASTAMEEGKLAGISILESLGFLSSEEALKEKEKIKERLKELKLEENKVSNNYFGEQLNKQINEKENSKSNKIKDKVDQEEDHREDKEEEHGEAQKKDQNEKKENNAKAVIDCDERIPCNPCIDACPHGAIDVSPTISSLPVLDESKCTGCARCVPSCPGLAIYVIEETFTEEHALVTLPYEFLPLPKKGEKVKCLDFKGDYVGRGVVEKVLKKESFNKTAIICVKTKADLAYQVKNIIIEKTWENKSCVSNLGHKVGTKHNNGDNGEKTSEKDYCCRDEVLRESSSDQEEEAFVCRCEEVTEKEIEKAISEGATTLKGIKLRTNAMMGLCQGRTCSDLILRKLNNNLQKRPSGINFDRKRLPLGPIKIEDFI